MFVCIDFKDLKYVLRAESTHVENLNDVALSTGYFP